MTTLPIGPALSSPMSARSSGICGRVRGAPDDHVAADAALPVPTHTMSD
jgi:hypothetical protein